MTGAERLIARRQVAGVGRYLHRSRVSVIAYHGVPDAEAFRMQLQAIGKHYSFISPNDLRGWLDGAALPRNPVLVTFDDGERSVIENAAPVLQDFSISSLLFVVAGLLDTDMPFWWEEVAALSPHGSDEVRRLKAVGNAERIGAISVLRESATADGCAVKSRQLTTADLRELMGIGVEIGNHSFDHPCLDRCDEAEATGQLVRAHEALLKRGIQPKAFAYPNGNLDTRLEPTLAAMGYDLSFLFDHHHLQREGDRLRLSRLRLDASASPERAIAVLSGAQGAVMRARGRG